MQSTSLPRALLSWRLIRVLVRRVRRAQLEEEVRRTGVEVVPEQCLSTGSVAVQDGREGQFVLRGLARIAMSGIHSVSRY